MKNLVSNLKKLEFSNTHYNSLFIKKPEKNVPQKTRHTNYSLVNTTPVDKPKLILLSKKLCLLMGLNYDDILNEEINTLILSGNEIPDKAVPIAHCYCGFQFGNFAGQLGDGRAITLGDYYNGNSLFEIQLKGAGITPYSRSADGRAVLRSSIREFLASENLYELGFPTTRALGLIDSKSFAKRDPEYNGKIIHEKCAIVSRVASSFMRFGSFEIFIDSDETTGACGPSVSLEKEMLPKMLDYLVDTNFKELKKEKNIYLEVFECIVKRTAVMVAFWQAYGFVHGVINTDNMSILGLTIDYGPYGFLEYYDKFYIPNSSDKGGRYSFSE